MPVARLRQLRSEPQPKARTLAAAARLQARSLRLRCATNFLRVTEENFKDAKGPPIGLSLVQQYSIEIENGIAIRLRRSSIVKAYDIH